MKLPVICTIFLLCLSVCVHDPATTPLSGDIYDGLWENGLKHGEGEIVYAHTGERSPGVWEFDDCMEEDTSALGCVLS